MLRLGTRVRINGRNALVIARTLAGVPRYDVRLDDGQLVKYAFESELEVVGSNEIMAPALRDPARGRAWSGHGCA